MKINEEIIEEADIEGFKTFREDRTGGTRGWTAIYLYDRIEVENIWNKRHNCEMVAIEIKEIQTINIVVYKPPNTKMEEF